MNEKIINMCKTESVSTLVEWQRKRYPALGIRLPNKSITKRIMFNSDATAVPGSHTPLLKSVLNADNTNISQFGKLALAKRI